MSRCFPFPCPGYEKNGLTGDDLVEWIKRGRKQAKRERENAKKERKRAKKREMEEKEKFKRSLGIVKREHSHENHYQKEMNKEGYEGGVNLKRREDETEQLNRSDLTEELEPSLNDQIAYESSDNSQNSKKRKLHNLFSDHGMNNDCSVDNSELRSNKEHLCSHSRRIELAAEKAEFILRQQQLCPDSEVVDIGYQGSSVSDPKHRFFQTSLMELELQFKELIESWIPVELQLGRTDFDEMELLFEMKHHKIDEAKRSNISIDESCHQRSNMWPQATYMPALDTYALPYTIIY